MGICLDTAASPVVGPVYEPHLKSYSTTRLTTHFPHRGVKRPQVPLYRPPGVVVYVLGGPGTGKVTLSEAVANGSDGKLCHISMTKVLKDYAKHFDMTNGSMVSSSLAVEMLTARMKASSARCGFVISGFPRNIDDVVECAKKISRLDGVILLDHRPERLELLVQDGVQTGALTPEAGEQELKEFLTHVLPLTELMSNKDVLYKINVAEYDVQELINEMDRIICKLIENGSTLHPDQNQNNDLGASRGSGRSRASLKVPRTLAPGVRTSPPVIFVIGGPGSNKSSYCERVVPLYPGWTHLSCSWMLRDLVTDHVIRDAPDLLAIRQLLVAGELVPQGLVLSCLSNAMEQNASSRGFIISGFPRNLQQLELFEMEHGRQSDIVLLDCSELELGRTLGRREDIDDTVTACRRRLELYRTVTLPAVKALDDAQRLLVIDGDCDEVQVTDELKRCIYLELQQLFGHGPLSATVAGTQPSGGADDSRPCLTPVVNGQIRERVALEVTEVGCSRSHGGPGGRLEAAADGVSAVPADDTDSEVSAASERHSQAVGLTAADAARHRQVLPEVEVRPADTPS